MAPGLDDDCGADDGGDDGAGDGDGGGDGDADGDGDILLAFCVIFSLLQRGRTLAS